MLVDTHTHIYLKEFDNDRNEVISNAIKNGVEYMLLPNIDSTTYNSVIGLSSQYPKNIFPMAGLHPTSVGENYKIELKILEDQLVLNKFIAIGEVGIDLYWDKTFLKQQQDAFAIQIELALQYDLPIVVHMRNSFDELWNVLYNYKHKKLMLVLHCFSGNMEQAFMAVDRGFMLGIGGVLTFKNTNLKEIAKAIPLEAILLETDAPYLAPMPHRGKRNEPVFMNLIAECLAGLINVDISEIHAKTTENAMQFFKIEEWCRD